MLSKIEQSDKPELLTPNPIQKHERAVETHEPSYATRATKAFFIPMAHGPLREMGHVAAPELSPRRGKVRSYEACGQVLNNTIKCKTNNQTELKSQQFKNITIMIKHCSNGL
jgi:hypothetical protein